MAKDNRARAWCLLAYPESAPSNWMELLQEEHFPFVVSPLHDLDTTEDGEIKKAHWHIVALFSGKKSYEQVKEYTDKINSPIPQKCADVRASVRYLIHLDNPEKYQYNREDIRAFNGFDADDYFKPTFAVKKQMLREITNYIHDHHITEFGDFMAWCTANNEEWFDLITDQYTLYTTSLIRSERHKPM